MRKLGAGSCGVVYEYTDSDVVWNIAGRYKGRKPEEFKPDRAYGQ